MSIMTRKENKSLPAGTLVQFTDEYLSSCTAVAKRQLTGRIGRVGRPRMGADHPTVRFEAKGRLKEIFKPEVDPKHLKVVPPSNDSSGTS